MLSGLPDAVETRQSDEQLADRRVGDFGDMLGTRPFRQGDSLHRQHCRVELVLHDQLLVAGESAAGFGRMMDALAQATLAESTTPSNRRRAASANLGITVTTPMGLQWRGRQLSGQHTICVSDGSTVQQSLPTTGAWISLEESKDVNAVLPRRWKGACNVR